MTQYRFTFRVREAREPNGFIDPHVPATDVTVVALDQNEAYLRLWDVTGIPPQDVQYKASLLTVEPISAPRKCCGGTQCGTVNNVTYTASEGVNTDASTR